MKRKFLTNLTLLIFLNLLVKPFWVLGIDLTVQNTVGASEYGFYFSLLSFSLLLNIVQDMGIASFNNRNIARDNHLIAKLLPNILLLKIILGVVYFTVSLAIALLIGYQLIQLKLLVVLLFNQFLSSMNLYLRSNIGGLQLFRTDSLLSVTDRLLMIIFCSVLLWGNLIESEFKIEWFVYAQTAAYLLTTIIISFIVIRKSRIQKIRLSLSVTVNMFKNSYPYALLGLLMVLYYRTDSVMLERMLNDGKLQAGIYAQGFRILDAASMLGFLFAGLLLPMFAKMIKQNEPVRYLFRFSFLLLIIPAITAAVGLNLYSVEIMDLLYVSHVEEASGIFGILMVCFVFVSCSIISGTLLTANGNMRELNLIASASVVLNITLNILLIPHYQALGSAAASMITQIFAASFQMHSVMKVFKLYPGSRTIKQFLFFIFLLLLTGAVVHYLDIKWTAGFFIICLTGALLPFLVRLLSIREIKDSLF